jgi:type VI secretion system protein ImpM
MTGLENWLSPAESAASAVPAWYGKLPALGDFAHRRGHEGFNQALDAWLQRAMPASQAQLQQSWQSAYVSAPLWNFAMFPGVVGDACFAGMLMSSVDRVGRYFPLAVYTVVPYPRALLLEFHSGMPWYRHMAQVLPQVLDTQFTQENFETLLQAAPQTALHGAQGLDTQVAIDWNQLFQQGDTLNVPSLDTAMSSLALEMQAHYLRGTTLWWSNRQAAGTLLRASKGWPAPDSYAQMLAPR